MFYFYYLWSPLAHLSTTGTHTTIDLGGSVYCMNCNMATCEPGGLQLFGPTLSNFCSTSLKMTKSSKKFLWLNKQFLGFYWGGCYDCSPQLKAIDESFRLFMLFYDKSPKVSYVKLQEKSWDMKLDGLKLLLETKSWLLTTHRWSASPVLLRLGQLDPGRKRRARLHRLINFN